MNMGLTQEDALNLRDGDVVLVPMVVQRTNNHFDTRTGVKVTCVSTQNDYRMREEREEKGVITVDIQSRYISEVTKRTLREGDWVKWDMVGPGSAVGNCPAFEQGKIVFIDGADITVKQRLDRTPRNRVIGIKALTRIPHPLDLTEAEKKVFIKK